MGKNLNSRLRIGRLTIDKGRFEVQLYRKGIRLTRKEFALLWLLASRPGMVFNRKQLMARIWGPDVSVEPRTVDAHMMKLRKKLLMAPLSNSFIETVWGIGYRLRSRVR
jgi:DNA-binding response OmpR family regulator